LLTDLFGLCFFIVIIRYDAVQNLLEYAVKLMDGHFNLAHCTKNRQNKEKN